MIDRNAKRAAKRDIRNAMERLILAAQEKTRAIDPPALSLVQTEPTCLAVPKVPVSIRLDRDLVEALRESGKGWQTRVNAMLRDAMELEKKS